MCTTLLNNDLDRYIKFKNIEKSYKVFSKILSATEFFLERYMGVFGTSATDFFESATWGGPKKLCSALPIYRATELQSYRAL